MKKRFLPLLISSFLTLTTSNANAINNTVALLDETENTSEASSLEVTHEPFKRAETTTGSSVLIGTLHVKAKNLKSPVTFEIRGYDKTQFSVEFNEIPSGTWEKDVKVSYDPLTVKEHKATLLVDCISLPTASQTIALSGIAIDKENPPTFELNPNKLEEFNAQVGKETQQTLHVTSKNLAENVKVKMAHAQFFKISSASIYKNNPTNLVVKFIPLHEGEFKDTIIFTSYGTQEVRIPVVGKATASNTIVEKEGTELKFDASNPLKVLDEHFDNVARNKPLVRDRWINASVEGTRAWWGYKFVSDNEDNGEEVAKVTLFDSKVEYGNETKGSMTLVTPPLDYKNAANKVFTIRLRGDLLTDDMTDSLRVYYIDLEDGQVNKFPLGGFTIPQSRDEAKEWKEYHVNLNGLDLADVFFIAFEFKGERGASHPATYYIDDISFGRKDLPIIEANVQKDQLVCELGQTKSFEEILVATQNTKEPIKLSLSGRHKSKFKLSVKELPTEGGSFVVSFRSAVEGAHFATVKLASRGAADQYIELVALNGQTTAISSITNFEGKAVVYDLTGNVVLKSNNTNLNEIKAQLSRGLYVVKANNKTFKVRID